MLRSTTVGACRRDFKSSHRPDGIFTCLVLFTWFALVLAGRRCAHRQWHGDLLIVHHHWQHSLLCVCSHSKFPFAPMGFSHVLRVCLQGGGVYIYSGTVTFSSCTITGNTATGVRAHAQNFHRPDGKTADTLISTRLHNCGQRSGQLQCGPGCVRAAETWNFP